MLKFSHLFRFTQQVFDRPKVARTAAQIVQGILKAQSPRISEVAQQMKGKPDSNYKVIQRFLAEVDPRQTLQRLFQVEAPFVLGDPTEIARPGASKTRYVGILKDGKTRGFWLMLLATPFRGRAIPFNFVTYSSRTIAEEKSSRNLNHHRAFNGIKEFLGEKPLVLDREFSYLELLLSLVAENINFVIRLNLGSHPPTFLDEEGQRVHLLVAPGQTASYLRLFYKGEVAVNVIGYWKEGLSEPLWVMTNLAPQVGLEIYLSRMKIEECLRDLKNLLALDAIMNKKQEQMEKMAALVMLAFSIGLLVGEEVRDVLYGIPVEEGEVVAKEDAIAGKPLKKQSRKWKLYSGLFVLLKQRIELSTEQMRLILRETLDYFTLAVHHPVRSFV